MSDLILTPNIDGVDDFYAELIATHEGLPDDDSHALNGRLVLILANHIGNRSVLSDAMKAATLNKE